MERFFVPFDLALKLKEKGFSEQCLAGYLLADENQFAIFGIDTNHKDFNIDTDTWLPAPLYQQAVDWFRIRYDIIIQAVYEGHLVNKHKFIGEVYMANLDEEDDDVLRDYYDAWNDIINDALGLI